MPPTFTAVDNGDGTGTTITVAGGDSGETHTVFYQNINGSIENWSFTQGSNRVGDGAIVQAVDGFHWWYVSSTVSGISAVKASYASDSGEVTHFACLEAVQARIRSLSLTDIDNDSIILSKIPSDRGFDDGTFSYPGIVISSIGTELQSPNKGTNERDDIEYPVFVSMLAADNQDLITNHKKYLQWRQRINKAFRGQRLPGVDSVMICKVQPGPVKSPTAFWKNYYHSSILIRPISRETRGI